MRTFVALLLLVGTAHAQSIKGIVTNGKTAEAGVWGTPRPPDRRPKFPRSWAPAECARPLRHFTRGMGAAHRLRAGDVVHGQRYLAHGHGPDAEAVRRLDRPRRPWRAAGRAAAAAARGGAQCGDHAVGLE